VDILQNIIYELSPLNGLLETFDIGLPAGCFGFCNRGGLIFAGYDGIAFRDDQYQRFDYITKINPTSPGSRFYDGKINPGGWFWTGTMGPGAIHSLYPLDDSHSICVLERGISISYGIG
jgi:sugar lactone lactonase YvrE